MVNVAFFTSVELISHLYFLLSYFLYYVFSFYVFTQNENAAAPSEAPWLQRPSHRDAGGSVRTPTYRTAPLAAHLALLDVPHAVLAPVLGLGAVTDARPLPDPSGTGDRAG